MKKNISLCTIFTVLSVCLPLVSFAQLPPPPCWPIYFYYPDYVETCNQRLTASETESNGWNTFYVTDYLGSGIDFTWYRIIGANESCVEVARSSSFTAISNGDYYKCVAYISGSACSIFYFHAVTPPPPPVPVPVEANVIACAAGQTTLSIQSMDTGGGTLEWREMSTWTLLGSQGYLETGEYYTASSYGVTIYHGATPRSFSFDVRNVINNRVSSAQISLSVMGQLPPITPTGTSRVCSTCSKTFSAPHISNATYKWSRNGSLINPPVTTREFTTSEAGGYHVRVQANGCSWELPTVTLVKNIRPVANAGPDRYAYYANMAATGSGTDADGSIVSYKWTQLSGTPVTINNSTGTTMSVTTPPIGTYVFRLTVTDNDGETGYDDVTIHKEPESAVCMAPLGNCGGDREFQTVKTPFCSASPTHFRFDVNEVNPLGGLIYTWYKVTGGVCELMQGQTGNSLITPLIQPGVVEFYRCRISHGGVDCYSFDFEASLSPYPPAIDVVAQSVYACSGGASTLEIIPEDGYYYIWKEATMGTIEEGAMVNLPGQQGYAQLYGSKLNIVHSGTPQAVTFTVDGFRSGAQCQIPRQATLSFAVVQNQVASIIEAPDLSRCGDGTVTLSAGGAQLGNFKWYSPLTVPWGTGAQIPSEHLEADKSYFVRATDQYGCNGFKEVKVKIKELPPVPVVNDVELCAWDRIHIVPENDGMINWYVRNSNDILQTSRALNLSPRMQAGEFLYEAEGVHLNGCTGRSKTPFKVTIPDNCDENLNWIHSKSFDTNGPIAEARTYFDDAGQMIQSQARNFTNQKLFASQPLKDRYSRVAASTLAAPLAYNEFKYNFKFVTNNAGAPYSYKEFDAAGKVLNADPVGNSIPGTLGWYFSTNNTWEDHVPVTQYPYARTDFYEDGSGEVRRSAAQGDSHRLGRGHEALSGTFPVFSELSDYLTKRSTALPGIVQDASLENEGVQSVVRDENGRYAVSISDRSGKTVMSARPLPHGTAVSEAALHVTNSAMATVEKPMIYFYLLHPQVVNINPVQPATYIIENLVTGAVFTPAGAWPVGFYRLIVTQGSVTVNYENYFVDVSYQFYDDAGRLKSSVSPNGYKTWASAAAPYETIDKTTYQYNHQGWLLSLTEPDAGTTHYVYRRDGKIRFSQNAEQAKDSGPYEPKRFSYTHYDQLGRPVESGEYFENAFTFQAMSEAGFNTSLMRSELEKTANQTTLSNVKKDWVKTHYDRAVSSIPNLPSGYVQTYVRGAVSWTENENIKTWYSYDELGRVTWMAQMPVALNRTFLTQYTYDFLGNVLTVLNTTYIDQTASSSFYHHYTYDADKRLSQVFTSPDGSTKKLRATYEYYLHGPLKRIELGENIQGVDFVYNINGWLTQINHPDKMQDPGGDNNDAFGMVLDYYESAMSGLFQTSLNTHQNFNPDVFHNLPATLAKESVTSHDERSDHFKELLRSYSQLRSRFGSTTGNQMNKE